MRLLCVHPDDIRAEHVWIADMMGWGIRIHQDFPKRKMYILNLDHIIHPQAEDWFRDAS